MVKKKLKTQNNNNDKHNKPNQMNVCLSLLSRRLSIANIHQQSKLHTHLFSKKKTINYFFEKEQQKSNFYDVPIARLSNNEPTTLDISSGSTISTYV